MKKNDAPMLNNSYAWSYSADSSQYLSYQDYGYWPQWFMWVVYKPKGWWFNPRFHL